MPTPNLSPKELGKQRLQMILVADRCGLSPSSLVEMKRNTLAALSDCMELEDLQVCAHSSCGVLHRDTRQMKAPSSYSSVQNGTIRAGAHSTD